MWKQFQDRSLLFSRRLHIMEIFWIGLRFMLHRVCSMSMTIEGLKTLNMTENSFLRITFCVWEVHACDKYAFIQVKWLITTDNMMTSSNGNIFRVTGPFCGEFIGHRWIPRTKASDAELGCFIWSAQWINGWVNNREAGDLRRQSAHYDVIVMRYAAWLRCFAWL